MGDHHGTCYASHSGPGRQSGGLRYRLVRINGGRCTSQMIVRLVRLIVARALIGLMWHTHSGLTNESRCGWSSVGDIGYLTRIVCITVYS